MAVPTIVEILNISLQTVAQLKALKPFDNRGTVLQYSKELSDYGKCKFRISSYDPLLTTYGDILIPHRYHVRIRKGTVVVWQGAIINNPKINKEYIEVEAAEYEFYLSKILVSRTSADPNGTGQTDLYRIFNSGTMAAAITSIITETIAKFASSNHVLSAMTIGTIENPNYPPNMVSAFQNGSQTFPLTGAWSFGAENATSLGPTLTFDYHTIQYILKAFGIYAFADHQLTSALVFNFKQFIGNKIQTQLTFRYGQQGNIVDYNVPRFGQRMANSLYAIATDNNGVILHANPSDQTSVSTYGLMEEVAAYSDVKSQSLLQVRSSAELPFVATPDQTNATIYLNENSYPLGQYDIGDIIRVQIKDGTIDLSQVRRIVGITVLENETGRETIAVQTNIPLPWQLPDTGEPI